VNLKKIFNSIQQTFTVFVSNIRVLKKVEKVYLLEKFWKKSVREETFHLAILNLKVHKLITIFKMLKKLKLEWQKSTAGTRQTVGKNLVWFGEIERKLAKLSKTTFTYRSSS
jgi:hypothetical protein